MKILNIDKNSRTQELITKLLEIWECSVRATHLFLSKNEIKNIKHYVPEALKNVEVLIIAVSDEDMPLAFM